MIRFKEQKIREERERMLQQEKKNLEITPWGRDSKKDALKNKKMQYLSFLHFSDQSTENNSKCTFVSSKFKSMSNASNNAKQSKGTKNSSTSKTSTTTRTSLSNSE